MRDAQSVICVWPTSQEYPNIVVAGPVPGAIAGKLTWLVGKPTLKVCIAKNG